MQEKTYTYDFLLQRVLKHVPDELDKSESSPIFSAIAPCCFELAEAYKEMENMLLQLFVETAEREFLLLRAKEVGIEPFPATQHIKKAEFRDATEKLMDVPLNFRFSAEGFTFLTTKKINLGIFELTCEQAGEASNYVVGDLLPVDFIENLATAKIIASVKKGEDEESTHHVKERYLQKVREPATSGNIYHYRRWCMEVQGVGAAKAFPLHNGNGTVKLIVVNQEMQAADEELLGAVRVHIEEKRPIGATVTVSSAQNKAISIKAKVRTVSGAGLQEVQNEFSNALKEHFKQISFKSRYVSLAKVGSLLLSVKNVLDYEELTMNNASANIELTEEEIPLLSAMRLEVII